MQRVAILLAGFAAGVLTRIIGKNPQAVEIASLKQSVADAHAHIVQQQTAWEEGITRVEQRLDAHESRLNELPSRGEIVSAIDEALSTTMQSLHERLSAQADSIELLKTAVSQTDVLLERVLECLDSLRHETDGHAENT